jgi:hypothetical protein
MRRTLRRFARKVGQTRCLKPGKKRGFCRGATGWVAL